MQQSAALGFDRDTAVAQRVVEERDEEDLSGSRECRAGAASRRREPALDGGLAGLGGGMPDSGLLRRHALN